MSAASQKMHEIFFQIPQGASLSVTVVPQSWRIVAIPALGGAMLAVLGALGRRTGSAAASPTRSRPMRCTAAGCRRGEACTSALQTLISNGFGASVGLEAAYTQMCGMIASLFGRGLGARRVDMRCWSAAARRARSPPLSTRRSPAPFTPSRRSSAPIPSPR